MEIRARHEPIGRMPGATRHREVAALRLDRRTRIHGFDDGFDPPHVRKPLYHDEVVAAWQGCEMALLRHVRALPVPLGDLAAAPSPN